MHPAALHAGLWHAYADHRMATTGALIGLLVPGVQIDDIGSTSKTLPQFTRLWGRMLGGGSAGDKLDGADTAGNGVTAAADILSGLLGGFGRA